MGNWARQPEAQTDGCVSMRVADPQHLLYPWGTSQTPVPNPWDLPLEQSPLRIQ